MIPGGGAPESGSVAAAARVLPKAELHCHIEGAASPALVLRQAERYGADVSSIIRGDAFLWTDFTSFLAAYDLSASLFRTPEDYALLVDDHLVRLASDGTVYAEFFVSPDHARAAGLDPIAYIEGLAEGMRRAETSTGIVSRMIVVGIRHFGPEAVETSARFATSLRHPLVTGFGLAGDERSGRPSDFTRAFRIAGEDGLFLTAHAGELLGADSIAETIHALKPQRIGHGVRAIEDRTLVSQIAEEGIVLEVCPNSNLALGIYHSPAAHPLRRLHAAGVRITLNSDDPPYFGTSLNREYEFARESHGFRDFELMAITRTAVEAAFVDPETRGRLLDGLILSGISLGAPATGA